MVTPGNIRKYGNPDFEDIAACLGEGILVRYIDETAHMNNASTKVLMKLFEIVVDD